MMKNTRGITLMALVITIILLLLLAGVTLIAHDNWNIISNTEQSVDMSKVNAMKTEIKMQIAKTMLINDREASIDEIIERLEKQEIIQSGDSDTATGQVKTKQDGYVYEIKQNEEKNWEVTYIGNGEIERVGAVVTLSQDTTNVTTKVNITMNATSEKGIASYTLPDGTQITVDNGETEVNATYAVEKNGTYTFTVETTEGKTVSKTITINNIINISGEIVIAANEGKLTKDNVIVTITWPENSNNETREVRLGKGEWQRYAENETQLTIYNNTVIEARVTKGKIELATATLSINNIDKLPPNEFKITATATTNSITVNGSTTDAEKTEDYASSGIAEYYFRIDGGEWVSNTDKTQTNYTFTGLTKGTEHTIEMKAVDKVGNEQPSQNRVISTLTLANLGEITIKPSGDVDLEKWTNEDITIEIEWPSNTEDYEKLVSTDGGQTWNEYTGPITIPENTEIIAKLEDNTKQEIGTDSLEISNIDKQKPVVTIEPNGGNYVIPEGKEATIKATLTSSDEGGSNVVTRKYIWTTDETEPASTEHWQTFTDGTEISQTGITTADTWYLYVKVIDNAGNRAETTRSNGFIVGDTSVEGNTIKIEPQMESEWVTGPVTVNITFGENLTKDQQIIVDGEEGTDYTIDETTNTVTLITNNKTITATAKDAAGNTVTVSTTVTKIDPNAPTASAKENNVTVEHGTENALETYFNIDNNGDAPITSIKFIDKSNNDAEVSNTSSLSMGVHEIECTVTKANGLTATATVTMNVDKICGKIYKVNDTEYHLVFNSTGAQAQGYTEEQLVYTSDNLKNGAKSNEWADYKDVITKVIIEDEITPSKTNYYFAGLSQITQIEGIDNIDTTNVTEMSNMFNNCSSITSLDLSNFNTANVTNMAQMFNTCTNLTTIYVSDTWSTASVTNSTDMFTNSTALKGAITYDSTKTDANYANWTTGYLTYKSTTPIPGGDSISITPDTTDWAEEVIITVTWPEHSTGLTRQISTDGGSTWSTYTEPVTITANCTIVARLVDGAGQTGETATLTINKIDPNAPTVEAKKTYVRIEKNTKNELETYFNIDQNGEAPIAIKFIDKSNNDAEVTNTRTLTIGTHEIECTVTKANGLTETATVTIEIFEIGVYGNLYEVGEGEYHLILNTTGAIAQGYTEEQLVVRGTDIKEGSKNKQVSGKYISSQPWGEYSENITKVKIEEEIKPIWTTYYFYRLTRITEIEGIENINTSRVTNMRYMFYGCASLTNLDVSGFDTSNVVDMMYMFEGCRNVTNLDVSGWDTSNVSMMRGTFYDCCSVSSLDVSGWNTSNVSDMLQMFSHCTSLTSLDLSSFNTWWVTNMSSMFEQCKNLKTIYVSDSWAVANVINSSWMFSNCPVLKGAISYDSSKTEANYANWTTGYLTYKSTTPIPGGDSISITPSNNDWATEVTVTVTWPEHSTGLTRQISTDGGETWNTYTEALTITQNSIIVARLKDGAGQTGETATLTLNKIDPNSPTISVKEANVTIEPNTNSALETYFNIDQNGEAPITTKFIDTSNNNTEVTNTRTLTNGTHVIQATVTKANGTTATATVTINVVTIGVYGNLYKISDTEYHLIFNSTGALAQGYTEEQLVERGTDIKNGSNEKNVSGIGYVSTQPWGPYSENITKVKIEEEINPTSTSCYFMSLSKITEIEGFENINTTNVKSMYNMFYKCSNLTSLDVSRWNTSNVTNMRSIFNGCSSLKSLDVSNWKTGKATSMSSMFDECSSLTGLDVSKWDTSNVTTMRMMFDNCSSLTSLDVSKWNTSKVTDMTQMFNACKKLTVLDVSNFNTAKVTGMYMMFNNCSGLTSLDVSNFNTASVTNMGGMFRGCSKLTTIYASDLWSTAAVTSSTYMFSNCPVLKGAISYDSTKTDANYANWTTGYLTYKSLITLTPSTTEWTEGNITVTVEYASILTDSKTLTCTGTEGVDYTIEGNVVTVMTDNQTITATAKDKDGNTITASLTVSKKEVPAITVTEKQATLEATVMDSNTFDSLFTVTTKDGGTEGLTKTYTLNEEATSYSNTNELAIGTHTLTCTATYKGETDSASVTITVPKNYWVNDWESITIPERC